MAPHMPSNADKNHQNLAMLQLRSALMFTTMTCRWASLSQMWICWKARKQHNAASGSRQTLFQSNINFVHVSSRNVGHSDGFELNSFTIGDSALDQFVHVLFCLQSAERGNQNSSFFFCHRGFYGFQLKCWWRYYCSRVTRIPAIAKGNAEWEFNLWWFEGKKWELNSIVASPGTSFRSLKRNFERFNYMCSMSKRAPCTCVNRSNEMVFDSHLSRPVIIATHPNWRLISDARWMTATTLID